MNISKRTKLGWTGMVAAACVCVAVTASAAQTPTSFEVEVYLHGEEQPVVTGGPWAWSDQQWGLPAVPAMVPLDVVALVRDEYSQIMLRGELSNISVPTVWDFYVPLFLEATPDGIEVRAGFFDIQVLGIIDLVPYAEVVEMIVDIKPGSSRNPLSPRSRGVFPVAVAGTDTLNVAELDPATLELAGVAAQRWTYEDVTDAERAGPDGVPDLVLFFDAAAVVGALPAPDNGATTLNVLLDGFLLDGQLAEGRDRVSLVGKRK